MLKETGIVTRIENDWAWVNTQSRLACSSCKVESTCGTAILEKYLAGKVFISKIKNELSAKVGDQVVIAIPKASVTQASIVVYCIPLFGLFIAALLVDFWLNSEAHAIAAGFVGFIGGLFVVRYYNRKIENNEHYQPKMVSKISTEFSPSEFETIKTKSL